MELGSIYTLSTRSRGLGRRIHGSVEDTKLSTNKQHSFFYAYVPSSRYIWSSAPIWKFPRTSFLLLNFFCFEVFAKHKKKQSFMIYYWPGGRGGGGRGGGGGGKLLLNTFLCSPNHDDSDHIDCVFFNFISFRCQHRRRRIHSAP